jgi:outer membrane protein
MIKSIQKIALIVSLSVSGLQAQKIAHINMDSLLAMMPETKTAATVADKISTSLNQEMMSMQTEFETKYNNYLAKEASMSELMKKSEQDALRQLEERTANFRTQAQQEYQRKTGELTEPIMEKAKKAVSAVAKEGGFKFVLDTSPQTTSVLYSDPADDILLLVKKKLDTMPAAVIPGADNAEPKATPTPAGPKPPAKTK